MANTTPTKLNLIQIARLLFLLIFKPQQFMREESKDNKHRESLPRESKGTPRAIVLRHALVSSFLAVLLSGLAGYVIGWLLSNVWSSPPSTAIAVIQVIGALVLLWGTLFIRGWEILSFAGVTFTERSNQWIYRSLYCLGTALVVISLVWS